jgi:hypothetical protein
MRIRSLLVAIPLLLLACSDSSGPGDGGTKPPGELNIVRLGEASPPLFNPVATFYAKRGEDREVRVFFQDEVGGAGEEYLRLRVDAPSLQTRPDGTPFVIGDSILITVVVVDPARLLFALEPSGLSFNPDVPAELKIHYDHADDDLDEDGDVDENDHAIEVELAIWRQELPGDPFVRLGSVLVEDLEEVEVELQGFSRYALAY